ncbi:MAG: R3H domain-containing nucleic acid-binding protein [bacterium]|nr:R3H domain-containing nucleic acid-binding protein [bacterium]
MEAAVEEILKELLDAVGVAHTGVVKTVLAGQTIFAIQMQDARQLIGMHGDTVHAIDHLVKKIAENRSSAKAKETQASGGEAVPVEYLQFLVDVNDYRAKQIKELETKAIMMAERARSFQYDVELTPMNAYERLIVHTVLSDSPNVKTESSGEGKNRRVVIKYAAN